jgi:hypothetical protein
MDDAARSPYLNNPSRLADVIAAIQAMATYKFYKLSFDTWSDRIGADSSKGDHWRRVFEEHPEFFRLDSERQKASLVWRRQYSKRFHVDREERLSTEEFTALPDREKDRVSRDRLTPADIKTLIDTAISLHSRAVELQRESRWWVPLVSSALGGLIGAILGVWLKH